MANSHGSSRTSFTSLKLRQSRNPAHPSSPYLSCVKPSGSNGCGGVGVEGGELEEATSNQPMPIDVPAHLIGVWAILSKHRASLSPFAMSGHKSARSGYQQDLSRQEVTSANVDYKLIMEDEGNWDCLSQFVRGILLEKKPDLDREVGQIP
ncbi:hypothetical protein J6590_062690 [Homalodisca vitripennis]|nr:hypothetical protein J6590_062690 [Homalodisca vitripennis]